MKRKTKRIFGFLSDAAGIATRYQNEKELWKNHLTNTKDIILSEAADKEKNVCMILGSGQCLDVPLNELSEIFDKIILADIVHPEIIKYKAKQMDGIELHEIDLTGIMEDLRVYKKKRKMINTNLLNFNTPYEFIEKHNPDYTVSVNLLSQISYFPGEYIKKHGLTDNENLFEILKATENAHFSSLPEKKSLLVTDFYEYEYNLKGTKIRERSRLNIKLPEDKIIKKWDWDFDLSGNYHTGNPVKFKVAALRI